MTRVLWVTAEPPDRGLGGGNIRQAHLLLAVARRAEVHLLVAAEVRDPAIRAAVSSLTEVIPVGAPVFAQVGKTRQRMRVLWHALAHREPMDDRADAPMRKALRPRLREAAAFDVVTVEHTSLAALLPAQHANRWALTMQQLASRRAEHELHLAGGRRQRWVIRDEQRKALRAERRALEGFDLIFVTSDADAAALPGRAEVVPNGVDTTAFAPTPLPSTPGLLLSGTLHWKPNVLGAQWFCTEVLPRLRALVPAVTLEIVGRGVTPEVQALAAIAGVTVHADVPAIQPYLQRARVSVVPLHIGSGTRVKALEAMAAGRPVVGTSIGLEGLGIEPGNQAAIVDEPGAMAAVLARLLTDDVEARRMAAAARELVERKFSWDRVGTAYAEILLRGLPGPGTAR